MSQLNLFEPTHKKEYEYFILVSPDNNMISKVKNEKLKLHNEIGLNKENLYSVPHISLFKFNEIKEGELVLPLIKKALFNVKSFTVELNELLVFDHGSKKSIAYDFKNPEPLCEINKRILSSFFVRPSSFKPHLTIAKSVPYKDFKNIKSLDDYVLKGSFLCDNITILRKEIGAKQKYKTFGRIWLN